MSHYSSTPYNDTSSARHTLLSLDCCHVEDCSPFCRTLFWLSLSRVFIKILPTLRSDVGVCWGCVIFFSCPPPPRNLPLFELTLNPFTSKRFSPPFPDKPGLHRLPNPPFLYTPPSESNTEKGMEPEPRLLGDGFASS